MSNKNLKWSWLTGLQKIIIIILIVDYMYFFPFYLNTKYFINMSLEWMWKILWLQISSAHRINAKHVFLCKDDSNEESVTSPDEDLLLDLLQSNTLIIRHYLSVLWHILVHVPLDAYMPKKGSDVGTRRAPDLHWQYQNFIGSTSSLESKCTHR